MATHPVELVEPRPFPGPVGGWLFFLAGAALLVATLIIPAGGDLSDARWQRDRALAREAWEVERIDRYQGFADALDRGDAHLVSALASAHLNLVPGDRQVLLAPTSDWETDLFAGVEPPLPTEPPRPESTSLLARLASSRIARLWLIAGSALCLMLGLIEGVGRRAG